MPNALEQLQHSIMPPQLQVLASPLLESKQLRLSVLRLDTMHREIQGNKWFKLRLNLARAVDGGAHKIVSFGGAYSNHLYALAAAGSALGVETVGFVRGEIVEPFNPVIRFLKAHNMALIPLSRSDYRRKADPNFLEALLAKHGPAYLIPEGGSNELGVKGCEDIAKLVALAIPVNNQSIVALACGTGATMAGVVNGFASLGTANSVLGVSVLKAPGYMGNAVAEKLPLASSAAIAWSVSDDYHWGGYGKSNPQLEKFMAGFAQQHDVPLEHVYTGKLFFALDSMIRQDVFPAGSHICALHTGGIV
ncbi:MAG: 1-aminocyclopropane-1-carboxylate deaminase [Pseudohongiellaceae bacterium]